MIDRVEVAAVTLIWLVAIYVPLEWAAPAWPNQARVRRHTLTDLAFFLGQHLVFAALASMAIAELARLQHGWSALAALRAQFRTQPLALQGIEAVLLGDLCAYWGHRLQHHSDFLWRFHAVHHTSEELDFLAAHREHPLDGLYTQTIINLPALVLGLRLDLMVGIVAFRALWAIFIHSNARIPLGPLRVLLGAPDLHHWHHAKQRDVGNYANLGPWVDWLFGTYHRPAHEPDELGIEQDHPRDYIGLLLYPFQRTPRRRDQPASLVAEHATTLHPHGP